MLVLDTLALALALRPNFVALALALQ